MSWYKTSQSAGWTSSIDPGDLECAADYLSDFGDPLGQHNTLTTLAFLQKSPKRNLGQIPVQSLPDDLFGWLETETGSITMPNIDDDSAWNDVVANLKAQTSSRDFTSIVSAFKKGTLSPVIVSKNGVLDGRGRVNFANALNIPVEAVEILY